MKPSMETSKGHMHQKRKNLKSTNPKEPKILEDPPMEPLVQSTNILFTKIIYHRRQIVTYLTGKSPVISNRGNKYLFVLYDYDRN